MKKYLITTFLCLFAFLSHAQTKQIDTRNQTWVGYFNQTRLSNKWGFWLDVHYRRDEEFLNKGFQFMVRPALQYYISNHVRATAGYAYVHHFPGENHKNIAQPEHRTWQQLQWFQTYTGFRTMQWLRLEQRYRRKVLNDDELDTGYNFNWRVRYNFAFMLPFKGKKIEPKSFFLFTNNEIFINLGKEIKYNYFDQNRFFVGLAYQTSAHANIQLGYMNVFQQRSSGDKFYDTHAIRLFYFQNLDFRKDAKH
jgi:hypothetical protein